MFISIWLLPVQVVLCMVAIGSQAPGASAFHVKSQAAMQSQSHQQRPLLWPTNMYSSSSRLQSAKHGEPDDLEIVSASEEMSAEVQAELDASRPSEWMVMKKILGINIFTYAIAAGIVFFFSMNLILGPGWLGNSMGLKGTGTFTEISDSLPDMIDLSRSDFLL